MYEYSSTTAGDIEIEIVETSTNETVGVKKFYSTSSAKVNVAPLLFDRYFPQPRRSEQVQLDGYFGGFPTIQLTAQGESTTQERTFTYAAQRCEAPKILTTMPLERILRRGECDTLTILAEEGAVVSYRLAGTPIEQWTESMTMTDGMVCGAGAIMLRIPADRFITYYSTLLVSIYVDDVLIGSVNYALSDDCSAGYRVAWLSSQGSIEHYTFPVVAEKAHLSSGATTFELRSVYGREVEIEALSEIVSSTGCWSANSTDYTRIDVLTTEQPIRRDGALMIANIKVRENG